jgi:ribonuclease HI/transposase InsO family protein
MTQIVEYVLSVDPAIAANVSNYIDDLFVNEGGIECNKVREHLSLWGLEAKEPEKLGSHDGVRVLGLRVDHNLNWVRDGAVPVAKEGRMSRRDAHSFVGELLGHYPRAGWLRVACAFIQRSTAEEKIEWEEEVGENTRALVESVSRRLVNEGDPVGGLWVVQAEAPMRVWVDASSLALGVVLEVEGDLVEDATWLRPRDDSAHINRCELDAVIRGINLALRWGRRELQIMTDSQTVYFWLRSVIHRTHNVRTKALDEVLIRRRLETLRELIEEENLSVKVTLVPSERNLADALTRVPKKWLSTKRVALAGKVSPAEHENIPPSVDEIRRIHNTGHFGVERTHQLAVERYGPLKKDLARQAVEQCDRCARFDPARKNRWDKGQISASRVWDRWAIDVCHVGAKPYLTMIDVASGFTLWRELKNESGRGIASVLRCVSCEFGPPESVMSDNGTALRSREVQQLFEYWEIRHLLTCAYRPQGNSVIERMHRTVKRTAARGGKSVEEAVFWVNCTSSDGGPSPYECVYCAKSRKPGVSLRRVEVSRPKLSKIDTFREYESCDRNPFIVGDIV